ncbi:nucleobase:cation symporter-2 family protein [Metabacillus fastidiosus]|uniref:nucleobase:cation symporter-2 family protein n=1 Tax=Metabacillus fastidiosus TaxID=1458 RepID=UPI003D2C2246
MKRNSVINEKVPISKLGILGFQHVLVMYSGAVLVPLILGAAIGLSAKEIAFLISVDLFTCGIATLLQVVGIGRFVGIKLPILLGCAIISLAPMIMIAKNEGLPAMYGAIIVSGVYVFILSFFVHKIIKFFPKIVIGCLVTIIGFSLIPPALKDMAGGVNSPNFGDPKNYLLAIVVVFIILSVNKFFHGFFKAIAVLVGLVVGTTIGYFMGMVNFESVAKAQWFEIVTPFYFGLPEFKISAILIMCIFATITVIESIGMYSLIGDICEEEITKNDVSRGVRAEGLAQIIGGVFNAFPYVTFSENAGIMSMTGVKARSVIISASMFLIALGIIPKFSALATIIPPPVLGGAMLVIFGMIGSIGIKMLSEVDLSNNNNLLIVACSISLGIGISVIPGLLDKMPELIQLLFGNGIFTGTLTAILLNIYFNFKDIKSYSESPDIESSNAEASPTL